MLVRETSRTPRDSDKGLGGRGFTSWTALFRSHFGPVLVLIPGAPLLGTVLLTGKREEERRTTTFSFSAHSTLLYEMLVLSMPQCDTPWNKLYGIKQGYT